MKKLALNKETIANLNIDMMNSVKGGVVWPIIRTTTTCTSITHCGQATCLIGVTCIVDTCDGGDTCVSCVEC
jgi:hypothetical protein